MLMVSMNLFRHRLKLSFKSYRMRQEAEKLYFVYFKPEHSYSGKLPHPSEKANAQVMNMSTMNNYFVISSQAVSSLVGTWNGAKMFMYSAIIHPASWYLCIQQSLWVFNNAVSVLCGDQYLSTLLGYPTLPTHLLTIDRRSQRIDTLHSLLQTCSKTKF